MKKLKEKRKHITAAALASLLLFGAVASPAGAAESGEENIVVQKVWVDGQENHAGDTVTMRLLNDNVEVASASIGAADGWTYTWSGLPAGSYSVKEDPVEGYTASMFSPDVRRLPAGAWVPAAALSAGETYVIAFGDRVLNSACDSKGVTIDENGTLPDAQIDSACQWVAVEKNGGIVLQQVSTGNYLYAYTDQYYTYTGSFDRADAVSLSEGMLRLGNYFLCGRPGWSNRFITVSSVGGSDRPASLYVKNTLEQTTTTYTVYNRKTSVSGGGGGAAVTSPETRIAKYVEKTEGDNDFYDLHLSFGGDILNTRMSAPVDIVFIVDTTGSMNYSLSGSQTRWNGITGAIGAVMDYLAECQVDAAYSMIRFWSYESSYPSSDPPYADAWVCQNWTFRASDISSTLDAIGSQLDNATNYEAAFYTLGNSGILSSGREGVAKLVFFLSDGEPNTYFIMPAGMTRARTPAILFRRRLSGWPPWRAWMPFTPSAWATR